ncbi:ATP-dependent helicase [Nocardioides marmorisolisilvae]|uniref:DNA 3'-5' helicase n=1 Tax=Nocardioides marmorisolisilvae TaxID=1542737 RepID=A0A3N0DNP0_9ACTN|nr:ATP-dependent DNA helicase [Nocardioides marmorisolisilvae]RNL77270.1 ATP-dependent helicase [Nocardioides marmorisolisilvae]
MTARQIQDAAALQRLMGTDFALSDEQFAAVRAPLAPAVVIAGAGSGKTEVMASRVVYLVATGQVRPDQVLGLTFTTKATASLARRIKQALDHAGLTALAVDEDLEQDEILEPTVATYNAYAALLLAEHGLRIGHEPDTRVMADASRYQLAARAIDQHRGTVDRLTDSPSHAIDALLALDSAMAEHLVTIEEVRQFHRIQRPQFEAALATARAKAPIQVVIDKMDEREEVLALVADYRRLKARHGLMDFSDQIALSAQLTREHPDVGRLEREKYRVVLLDEYQDTSVAQAQLLAALFSGPDPASGRGHPVTAVGDPNQAIYGWRGASVSNILNFGDFFPADGPPAVHHLTTNLRSDERILEVANALAAPLYDKFDVVEPLMARPGAARGEVRTDVHNTYADELAWLPAQVRAAWDADRGWSEIGVLTRDNEHAADVFDALTEADIPVEIVGLKGLLRLPEVSEVVATLAVLTDLTANADLLTLLSGPRWAIGPRDLALLGARARELADTGSRRDESLTVTEELSRAVAGADPTEVLSLADALDDPGERTYSSEGRERFALLSEELRMLRRHVGEPLLDLVRRIVDTTGIDVELASSVSKAARARRDNLDLFIKAVAEFEAVDGQVTLTALLAWLNAEDEFGTGLDVATPSESDSVKLLTVHRSKGLEWDSVFLVGVCEERFPVTRGRSQWTTVSKVMPTALRGDAADQPRLGGYEKADLDAMKAEAADNEADEQLRLGYVAFTRARHLLHVSSYLWRDSRQKPLGPSPYQRTVLEMIRSWGEEPGSWADKPADGTPNPLHAEQVSLDWPVVAHTPEVVRRLAAAELVRAAMDRGPVEDEGLDMVETAKVADWDQEIAHLLAEARADAAPDVLVPLPTSLAATSVARIAEDPDAFARVLARPMPRPPSRAARFGTRFHTWVEQRFGQQQVLDPDDLPGRADVGIESDEDLAAAIEAFEAGPFAERVPHATETPFALVLAGQVVRGRIDAVFAEPDGRWLVVDWKTGRADSADPLQLAVYRLAWAELVGVPVEKVSAAFHYVRTGETVEPDDLLDRPGLEGLLR